MRIGFIGTGNMGRHMARSLQKAGNQLTVHDQREEATHDLVANGAAFASTPRDVARASEVVFTSLPGPQQVEAVVLGQNGVAEGAARGSVYVDLSTSSPTLARRMAATLKARGIDVLDAPVSGGVTGAEAATLSVLVGGDEAVYQRVKPLLDKVGDKAMYCGPAGAGQVCKICNNLISLSLSSVFAEALTAGVKAGVPLSVLHEAISKSSGATRQMQGWVNSVYQGEFSGAAGAFFLDWAAKDVHLALELGREFGVPMEVSHIIAQRYVEAQGRGWGRMGSGAVVQVQEEHAGTKLRL
jgi:3-hydroxyisobutyrate dehydrogenase